MVLEVPKFIGIFGLFLMPCGQPSRRAPARHFPISQFNSIQGSGKTPLTSDERAESKQGRLTGSHPEALSC
jgi:hypothetical protein